MNEEIKRAFDDSIPKLQAENGKRYTRGQSAFKLLMAVLSDAECLTPGMKLFYTLGEIDSRHYSIPNLLDDLDILRIDRDQKIAGPFENGFEERKARYELSKLNRQIKQLEATIKSSFAEYMAFQWAYKILSPIVGDQTLEVTEAKEWLAKGLLFQSNKMTQECVEYAKSIIENEVIPNEKLFMKGDFLKWLKSSQNTPLLLFLEDRKNIEMNIPNSNHQSIVK